MAKKVYFKTFGCRTNIFDTQVMVENLGSHERVDSEEAADCVVINACTVTNGADSGVRNYVNRLHRSGIPVYYTGCGVESQGRALFEQNKIQGLFYPSEKERITEQLDQTRPFFDPTYRPEHIESTLIQQLEGKSRAFLKIQEGCDYACSFCIIPFSRGKARSKPESQILEQTRILIDQGYSEFILTGTNVGSYGGDLGNSLSQLITKMGQIPGIRRIRIGSLEPSQIDSSLIDLMQEPFMAKQLHIALQHSSDSMLELMNRHNRVATDRALLENIAEKGLAIGTDYIVGHPGESEAVFEEAFRNLEQLPLTHIHLFPYSPREGTPSSQMQPTISGDVTKQRIEKIRTLITEKNRRFRENLTAPLEVHLENSSSNQLGGYDQFYNHVIIASNNPITTPWVTIKEYTVGDEKNYGQI